MSDKDTTEQPYVEPDTYTPQVWRMAAPEPEDQATLRLKLLQSVSEEVADNSASAGHYYIDGIGEIDGFPLVVPLAHSLTRVLRGEGKEDEMGDVLCYSGDGVQGNGSPGGACHVCPMSQWDNNTGTPPVCREIRSYLCYVVGEEVMVKWSLYNTGLPVAKTINSYASVKGWGNFALQLGSTQVKGRNRNYYRSTVKRVDVPEGVPTLDQIPQLMKG